MNESDSERIVVFLEKQGYKSTKDMSSADLIVVNACSVRQTAIDRILGLKPKFKKLKAKKILTGCVLESDKKKFEEFFDEIVSIKEFYRASTNSSLIPIMTGCNNFCSYCVVPYTRGREKSIKPEQIIKQAKNKKEIILLGQNVNSYEYNFPELLKKLNKIPSISIIKFLTNHPKDFSDALIDAITKCKKVSKEIHLPIQSGDDEVLKRMNRGYTVKQYKNLVKKIREKIPNVKISTDVIVGFPNETKKQFENTVKLFKEIKYDLAYVNKYSTRAGTAACKLKDNVSWQEKKRRWNILNEIVNKKPKLIVVVGPTATGKSDLAIKLAKKFNGEIISADSRQVYKGMDIGTNKIIKKEMQGIPHYLLDIASPKRQFTVAQYKQKANKVIKKIYKKNKIPIICGGTGFYIQAVVEGLEIPRVKPDQKLRKRLEKETIEALFKKLKKLDPCRAKNIDSKNRRRLIRALEIVIKTGKPVLKLKTKPSLNVLFIGIKKFPKELKELIDKRVDKMIKNGLEKEVKKLVKKYGWTIVMKNAIGYQEFREKNPIEKIKLHTYQFVKRQMTWFKRNRRIYWIEKYKEAEKLARKFLNVEELRS